MKPLANEIMSESFTEIIKLVITLFLLLLVGFTLRKINVTNDEVSKKLSELIMKIGLPFMIINALMQKEYSAENLKTGLLAMLVSLALHTAMAVFAKPFCRIFGKGDEAHVLEFSTVFLNAAIVGFPLLTAYFPENGVFMGAFYVIPFNILMWSYGVHLMGKGHSDNELTKLNVRKIFINPGTVPCAIGFALFILQPYLPEFINGKDSVLVKTTGYLGSLCVPVSMIIVGGLIAKEPLSETLKDKKIYIHSAFKLILLPLLLTLISVFAGVPDNYVRFVAIMSAIPSAANSVMFAEVSGVAPKTAARAVGMTTLLSVITIPAVMYITELFLKTFR